MRALKLKIEGQRNKDEHPVQFCITRVNNIPDAGSCGFVQARLLKKQLPQNLRESSETI
jgi:hypothetical protein